MSHDSLLDDFAALTGDLFSDPSLDASALNDVRGVVARALRDGQPPDRMTPDGLIRPWPRADAMVDSASREALELLLSQPLPSGTPPLVLRRTGPTPSALAPEASPLWARGRKPSRTVGPFVEATTRPVWFHLFEDAPTLMLARVAAGDGTPEPVMAFGRGEWIGTRVNARDYVWIRARALDAAAPSDAWCGLLIKTARLSSNRQLGSSAGGSVVAAVDATLRLDCKLPVQPAGQPEPAVSVTAPTRLTITFAPDGVSVEIDDAVAASLFGQSYAFSPAPGDRPRYSSAACALAFPLRTPEDASFAPLPQPARRAAVMERARVLAAGLAFPCARLDEVHRPEQLGPVDGPAALLLELDAGLVLADQGMAAPAGTADRLRWKRAEALVRTDEFWVSGPVVADPATGVRLIAAWKDDAPGRFDLRTTARTVISVASSLGPQGSEAVFRSGMQFDSLFARPLPASGTPLRVGGIGSANEITTAAGTWVSVSATRIAPESAIRPSTFVLDNGLVRARKPDGLLLEGELAAVDRVAPGWLTLAFTADLIAPGLPDPYTTDFLPWDRAEDGESRLGSEPVAALVAATDWRGAESATEVAFGFAAQRRQLFVGTSDPVAPPDEAARHKLDALFRVHTESRVQHCRLLDVSGRSHLLGVAMLGRDRQLAGEPTPSLQIVGLELTDRAENLDLLTLPGFQNEAVVNQANPGVLQFPDVLEAVSDGGPQRFRADATDRVVVQPLALAEELLAGAQEAGRGPLYGALSLPFGIRAVSRINVQSPDGGTVRVVALQDTERRELEGAWQLRLEATHEAPLTADSETPSLPGIAHQLNLGSGGRSVLGDLTDDFNNEFSSIGPGPQTPRDRRIPVARIDVSGYGNSLFSQWSNPAIGQRDENGNIMLGVREVRFDGTLGRTAHEVVQIVSVCHPYNAPMVREIVLRRTRAGSVLRADSGWRAAGDGLMDYAQMPLQLGAVRALRRIANIRETPVELVESGLPVRAVRFDALADLEGVDGPVPVRDIEAWVQLDATSATAAQVLGILDPAGGAPRGPVYGRADAQIKIGGAGPAMRVSAIGVERGGPGTPFLCAVVRGDIVAPPKGSWSIVRKEGAAHRRLGPREMVPLTGIDGARRIREPREAAAAPQSLGVEYGILHTSDAHRFLLRDPIVALGSDEVMGGQAPLFADPFVVAQAAALMPAADSCVRLPDQAKLRVVGGGHWRLQTGADPIVVPGGQGNPWRTLCLDQPGATPGMRLEYRNLDGRPTDLSFAIDTASDVDWSLTMRDVSVASALEGIGDFVSTGGAVIASSRQELKLADPGMRFSSDLGPLQGVMDFFRGFVMAGAFAAATAKDGKAVLGFEGKVDLPPKKFEKALDFGSFKIKGELEAGIYVTKPFGSPAGSGGKVFFSIAGKILVPVIHLGAAQLRCGGKVKVKYEYNSRNEDADKEAKKNNQPLPPPGPVTTWTFVGGTTGNILLGAPNIAKAEVSVTQGFVCKVKKGDVKLGYLYEIEGEFDLIKVDFAEPFGSLLGLTLGFESIVTPARLQDTFANDTDVVRLEFDVEVAVDITVGWLVSAGVELPLEFHIDLGLPTFAAFVFANPALLAAEPLM
ncbi:MAG: hypothetical protein EOR00_12355 [Mesorhizobium sp.]|uniref:hypothetical protein n=1 Tax=Mesorhizobium sp. TaxID=1871066 RepID=UPI000FE589DE|nr:hypothetical protein [Mesorhizobium sp.]RWP18157.1 MAG: hypothetical protein EOR00_12355 [Mesorhizobium sp.]